MIYEGAEMEGTGTVMFRMMQRTSIEHPGLVVALCCALSFCNLGRNIYWRSSLPNCYPWSMFLRENKGYAAMAKERCSQ